VMGMIYFSPFIANRLVFLPKGDFFDARGVLSQTLAAQVMTLPILVYNFGMVSVYSAPANMLVVPLVPLMTVAGFVLAFAGAIFAPLAWLVCLPVWLFIQYLISVVETLSRLPAATASVGLPWFGLAACYAAIAFAAWTIHQHERLKFLDY